MSYLTQTTLSVDETNEIIGILGRRFPQIQGPPKEDICYATQNRQDAVKEIAIRADVVLVIGSDNSSNSKRLAEVAAEQGTPAYLVDDETQVRDEWLRDAGTVGLTSGASAISALDDNAEQPSNQPVMANILAMGGAHSNSMFVAAADRVGTERGQPFIGSSRIVDCTSARRS